MNDRNREQDNREQTPQGNKQIQGRVDNTENPDYEQHENNPDISQVDRQEGTMNHGELGGNFNKDAKEKA